MTPAEALAAVRAGERVRVVVGKDVDDPTLIVWADDGTLMSAAVAGWSAGVLEPVCAMDSEYLTTFFDDRERLELADEAREQITVRATLVLDVEPGALVEDAVRAYMADHDLATAFERVDGS